MAKDHLLSKITAARANNEKPIIRSIAPQNANHILVVVDAFRNVATMKLAPSQKTRFPAVSAVLLTGERHINLSANTKICSNPIPKQN